MQLEWPAYAVDCSESDEGSGMLCVAVASFVPSRVNYVRLYHKITLTEDDEGEEEDYDLRPMGLPLPFDFVATKLKFVPGGTLKGTDSEFLAVAGLGVTLWRRDGHNLWSPAAKLVATPGALRRGSNPHLSNNNSSQGTSNGSNAGGKNPPAPVTSFDWSRADNHLLVTGSFDTTCTVWDVTTSAVRTQLIAHDKEVYDVACSAASPDLFVSVGGEGSLRMFDTRNLDHSTILYESKDASPLVRVGWNRLDGNFVCCFGLDAGCVPIIDVRSPAVPVALLPGHVGVIAAQWGPHSASHLMLGDDRGLHVWDLRQVGVTDPSASPGTVVPALSLAFPAGRSPVQFAWSSRHPDTVAYVTADELRVTRI